MSKHTHIPRCPSFFGDGYDPPSDPHWSDPPLSKRNKASLSFYKTTKPKASPAIVQRDLHWVITHLSVFYFSTQPLSKTLVDYETQKEISHDLVQISMQSKSTVRYLVDGCRATWSMCKGHLMIWWLTTSCRGRVGNCALKESIEWMAGTDPSATSELV